ncbi:MAG: DUF1697 domain-containing protein [Flavobacteriaceae bacterium]|jgi:uncharacterized protein (DUF1697 family)|nr:DUF1697 domain-containing protein [Flavobacteriaceae bacterium]
MQKFCAFLRGVNVKGTNMKMADVCGIFEKSGMKDVSSVLASGNILFSSEKSEVDLKKILEQSMSEYFDYEVFIFIKDKNEIENLFGGNSFENHPEFHIYGFVGIAGIEKILMQEFEKSKKSEGEDAKIMNGNFYWKISKGNTLDSQFGKILGRKDLKNAFTSRNLNTFEKILKRLG